MEALRTPEERFTGLADYPFAPRYLDLEGLRVHYIDEGPADAPPVLLLHGEPSWSYLYRKILPVVAAAGYRAVAPDLIGFGRSDKPARREDHTYERHVRWTRGFMEALALEQVTLVCHDWGGLIGLRLVGEEPERFAAVVACNTFLPTGDLSLGPAFFAWRRYSQETPELHVGGVVSAGCTSELPPEVVAAYDAPFPGERYKAAVRQFPMLVPTSPDDPAAPANRKAWDALARWKRPFLTAFSDADPITRGADRFLQQAIPGAHGQPHATLVGAGHFLQEDKGPELARIIVDFLEAIRARKARGR